MKYRHALIIILLIIVADQAMKIFIKTHFANGDEVNVMGHWFKFHFIENEGMAYGLKISDSSIGKLILTSFRLVAVVVGFYLLKQIINKGYYKSVVICGAMILAGALGNLIDSLFYGLIFSDSPPTCFSGSYEHMSQSLQSTNHVGSVAHFTAFGQGYGHFLLGKVVDMMYFPIVDTQWPSWVPVLGGRSFVFFEPVFNIADAAISVGVIYLLIQSLFTKTDLKYPAAAASQETMPTVPAADAPTVQEKE